MRVRGRSRRGDRTGSILNELRHAHRQAAIMRGPKGLMMMYGYTEEEADLIWAIDHGGGYEQWMEDYGKGMADVVKVYNSTRRKFFAKLPAADELDYAYIGGGKVHFTDK